ncbi:MAG: DUF1446 domain-containing protein [Robiginitomaculum sp.]|nr:DUF1446 domain-containing protein [Robiginitomaculum sp.]
MRIIHFVHEVKRAVKQYGERAIKTSFTASADIVFAGRRVGGAVTFGVCIHEFGWGWYGRDKPAPISILKTLLEER